MKNNNLLVSGPVALAMRDTLEAAIARRFPTYLQVLVSTILTWISGLAPSSSGGMPPVAGSERRAFWLMIGALAVGGYHADTLLGGLALVYGMRSFSSVVGHHMTHGAQVLPGPKWVTQLVYDLISAVLLLPRFAVYKDSHQKHHAYTAGPKDPDQQFIAYLGAQFDGALRFAGTVMEPRFHLKFLWERFRSVLLYGPVWRRSVTVAFYAALAVWAPGVWLLGWSLFAGVAYQTASLVQWASEHLWGKRPEGLKAVETATAVTFGRLLLLDPAVPWFWAQLAAYAVFRALLVTGDLVNHDLHHVGQRRWADHAYVRTRLILEGKLPLRQTMSVRGMFQLAFESARADKGGGTPLPPRAMDGRRMMEM